MNLLTDTTDLSAYRAGQIIVTCIPALLILCGIIKCLSVLRQPKANKICLMALAMALLGLLALACTCAFGILLPEINSTTSSLASISLLLSGLLAFILAIVGLATYEHKRHVKGRSQAVWSMVLSSIFMIVGLVGVVRTIVARQAVQVSAITNVERQAWGYRTQLNASDWNKWPNHGLALADFAAMRSTEAILIIPLDLGDKAPDIETIAAALLARLGIAYPSDEGWITKPWKNAWGEGLEITGARVVDDSEYDYILRVTAKGRYAHMHAGWATKKSGDLTRVRTALDSIILLTTPQSPAPILPPEKVQDFGLVCNDIGIALYSKNEFKESAHWFKLAFEQTHRDASILSNVADALRQAGLPQDGLEYLNTHISSFPQSASPHLHHAYLLSDSGDHAAACKAFLTAIEAGLKDENKTLAWLQHLNEKEQYQLAEQAAEAWMNKYPGVNSRRWHAQTVAYTGDAKRSLDLVKKLSAEFPEDRRVIYDLGEAFNEAGEHVSAAEVAGKLLDDGKNASRALMILGWSQMGRKWYREAKTTFEKVSVKEPENEIVKNALRRASAMLGQGNNSDIKTPIEAVALPDSVEQAIKAHPAEKNFGNDQPYAWLLTAKGYYFEPSKPARRTWHRRARINTTEGANELSSVEFSFDSLSERIYINQVTVLDDSGKTIASTPGDAYVMDIDSGSASHRKKLHFQIPALRPGCTVEYKVSIEDLGKAKTFTFERHLFGDSAADIAFVTGNIDNIQVVTTRTDTLKPVREKNLIAWMGFNLPYDRREPMNGLYEDRVPGICFSGMEGSWDQLGEEFLKDIEDRLKPDAKAVELAAKLIDGKPTPHEKIAALAGYVQKQISYTAIEFGTRARRPNLATQTLQQQYGDCKDQSLLLHQLLQAAGIESHLALVNSEWRIQPALPTLDQFNHMVVQVPTLGQHWLIDPTNKNIPPQLWHADDLWHSHALILQPNKVRLAAPYTQPAPDSALVKSRRSVRPEGDVWHVDETFVLHGYYAAWIRGTFNGLDTAAQLRKIQGLLEKNARVRVHHFTFETLTDISQPAKLVISYDVSSRLYVEDGLTRAVLPALLENEYLLTTFVKERQTPFLVRYPFCFRSEVAIEGMPQIAPTSLKALNHSASGSFTNWKLSASTEGNTATIHFEFASKPGEHPPASYHQWHDEWTAALKAWDHPLVWKP